ncbi:hypothetical protein AAC387_Pa06g0316 [Persea americana]
MDYSTPTSRRSESRPRSKSVSRLLLHSSDEFGENLPPNLSLTPPSKKFPSPLHLSPKVSNADPIPLHEILLHSPSPLRRSKSRIHLLDGGEEAMDQVGSRRKCRSRALSSSLMGCASPKGGRRGRRRLEHENREERDLGLGEENGKVRKRKQSRRVSSHTEKLSSVPLDPSPCLSPENDGEDWSSLDSVGKMISELIMWKDIAKSSLWFGFGSLCFLSSCFTRGLSFSIISAMSQLGLLFLAMAFFYNSFSQRHRDDRIHGFKLKEEDIIRATRVILPAANAAIAMTRELFSGEPSMTLKMAPILVIASEYGHLITLWRLFATGFFISFTVPKLYSCYSSQINRRAEYLRFCVWDAWEACSHKRIVVASAATVFWNLSTFRTRIFAAFISVVVLRYYQQQSVAEVGGEEEGEQQLALVVAEGKKDHAVTNYK